MTLFHYFSLFFLQVIEKLNVTFWNSDYFQNWLSFCDLQLYLLNLFSTFANGTFADSTYPKKIIELENYIVKYVCLVH